MEKVDRTPAKIVVSTILLLKPGIIVSVAFTGFAGMVVGYRGLPPLNLAVLGIISLLLSAGGSAVLNNVLDQQMDLLMDRLSKRVEALKVLGERTAVAFSVIIILISLFISAVYLNYVATILILCAILSYTLLYTLYLKRSSPFGTILGGIPGALPVLIGYSVVKPNIGIDGLILFIFMILWQPPHFWALAQKYKDDYKKAGVPVMPVAMGTKYTNMLILLYSISLLPLSLTFWFMGYCSQYYAIIAIVLGIYFEYVIVLSVIRNRGYGRVFGASILYMLAIMASLVVDIALNPVIRVVTS
ncbi:MAG: heme o synthase [Thermodesulfobacteriota bacterium]